MLINYGEVPQVVHTRLVLGHIVDDDYLIRTPDGDEYVETLHSSNPDFTNFHVGPEDGSLPPGVAPGVVYGFAPLSLAQLNAILIAGKRCVEAARFRLGLGAAAPPAAAPNQQLWVLAEWIPGRKIGDPVVPPLVL